MIELEKEAAKQKYILTLLNRIHEIAYTRPPDQCFAGKSDLSGNVFVKAVSEMEEMKFISFYDIELKSLGFSISSGNISVGWALRVEQMQRISGMFEDLVNIE